MEVTDDIKEFILANRVWLFTKSEKEGMRYNDTIANNTISVDALRKEIRLELKEELRKELKEELREEIMNELKRQRVARQKQAKSKVPKALREAVWNTYVGNSVGEVKCHCCTVNMMTQMNFHCGHVTAFANGGLTTLDNLRPICSSCNLSMGTENLLEFKATYFTSAKIPCADAVTDV